MVAGWLVIAVGIGYGYFKRGRQDKSEIFKAGVVWGLIIALVLAGIGWATETSLLGFGADFINIVISFVIILALFVLGVFIGDWLEHR